MVDNFLTTVKLFINLIIKFICAYLILYVLSSFKTFVMKQREILNRLSQYKRDKQDQFAFEGLGIFGSVAKDEMTDHSDIDVFVQLPDPDIFIMGHIKSDLEEIFQMKIDIVRVRNRMNTFLKNQIINEGIYV